jgi:hypothetical protein
MRQYSTLELPDASPGTVCVTSYNRTLSSMAKAVTANVLAMILARHPSIAMPLGKLVKRIWPNFRMA